MRILIVPLCFLVLLGCRDESQINDGSPSISGYRIEGSVVDSMNSGIYGVTVRLAYTFLFVDSLLPDSRELYAPHPGTAQIRIYTMFNTVIRELYDGYVDEGSLVISWNRTDGTGRHVGSGLYYFSFSLDGAEIFSYPILIDSALTTFTDNTGRFAIEDVHFPIGVTVPRFSTDGKFLGNFLVFDTVQLIFELSQRRIVREVTVSKGRLATVKQIF